MDLDLYAAHRTLPATTCPHAWVEVTETPTRAGTHVRIECAECGEEVVIRFDRQGRRVGQPESRRVAP